MTNIDVLAGALAAIGEVDLALHLQHRPAQDADLHHRQDDRRELTREGLRLRRMAAQAFGAKEAGG